MLWSVHSFVLYWGRGKLILSKFTPSPYLEVAAVVLEDNLIVDRFSSLMNPGIPIPLQIQSLTGITNKMVRSAPPVSTVMGEFANFIRGVPLIAHKYFSLR